jgi:hypothetical protein
MAVAKSKGQTRGGKLRIGDDWNAIRIIALSQNNPLKAVAEFVENSIDAGARTITITRGREHGEAYLKVSDDGAGVPKNTEGAPDFRYVATHICDSIKRRLKTDGLNGVQGEFGIGLLSFWTVGENLAMTSTGTDGRAYTMYMKKGGPAFSVRTRRLLFERPGTEIHIAPLLPGLRQLNGEKIQWYLASELRERIRQRGADIRVVDRTARKEFKVEPRAFTGRLLRHLPAPSSPLGEIYAELYLAEAASENRVGLYRRGTRVVENIGDLEGFAHAPWSENTLTGIVDAPFLNLTPATRSGLVHDERLAALTEALAPLEARLNALIEEQRRAESERASRNLLRTLHKAFREALLALPAEEYDWFDVRDRTARGVGGQSGAAAVAEPVRAEAEDESEAQEVAESPQRPFYEFAGPLARARIAPASCVLPVGKSRAFRALARDRSNRAVEDGLRFRWHIAEGNGTLDNAEGEIATYTAPGEPALVKLALEATQNDIACEAEALVTVTDSLLPESREPASPRKGLPGYTFERAPGKLWRSRFNVEQNVIVVNNGHRDFVYASKAKALKLRYIARLYAKELVLHNFPGEAPDTLLERLIELSLYTEENLR